MLQLWEINTYMSSTAVLSQNYMKLIQTCQALLYFPKIIGNCWVGRINATAIKDLHYNRNLKILSKPILHQPKGWCSINPWLLEPSYFYSHTCITWLGKFALQFKLKINDKCPVLSQSQLSNFLSYIIGWIISALATSTTYNFHF